MRLIDAGSLPFPGSQTIYHGLAHARTESTPDTLILARPREPYVCIGFHQDREHELDLDYCRRNALPVLRRETGGGAVYLDPDQLFVIWVMGERSLPERVEARFASFAEPLLASYRELGIPAVSWPPGDVHVGDRKISGSGAARIGNAEVVTGNFLCDLDSARMAGILRARSEACRAEVERCMRRYMTSIRHELGRAPDARELVALYCQSFERARATELRPGKLLPDELLAIQEAERRMLSPGFLGRPGGMRRRRIKIHAGVHVLESRR